jgi:hypothetical protein
MNEKRKWITAGRLRRGAVILGVAGLTAGAAVMTAGSALAGVGSQPGNLSLSAATGALNTTPTWSTTDGCPTGFQGSAQLAEFDTNGNLISRISPTVASVTTAFSGTLDGNVGALMATVNGSGQGGITASNPGTEEWAVGCWTLAGATGSVEYTQSLFISIAAGATTYTTSSTGPVVTATTTTLTATPSPAPSGGTVGLSASVKAADGTTPAGTVQFESGGTDIGSPVAVNTGGTATPATTSFTAPTTTGSTSVALSAVFTPTSTTSYASSTGTFSLLVQASGTQTAGAIPVDVTVPATGQLTVTVSTTAINLAVQGTTAPLTATGTLNTVSVSDTRNTVPGWSVSGQDIAFTGSGTAAGSTIPGDDLGWAPSGTVSGGATIGATVAPGASPGLADAAQVLASAAPGSGTGTDSLSAALTLDIPASALAGPYTSTLTITYLLTGP